MSSSTKQITASTKEHDQSVREPSAVLQNKKSDKHFVWAQRELRKVEERKSVIINELAKKLDAEKEIEKTKISTEIAYRLSAYVTDRYVQQILPDKYKVVYRVQNAQSSRTSSAKQVTSGAPPKNILTPINIVPAKTQSISKVESVPKLEPFTTKEMLANNDKIDIERKTTYGNKDFEKLLANPRDYSTADLNIYSHELLKAIIWYHRAERKKLLSRIAELEKSGTKTK